MPKIDRSAKPVCHRALDCLSVLLRLDSPPSANWTEVFNDLAIPEHGFKTVAGMDGIEGGHAVSAPLGLGLSPDEVPAILDGLVDFVEHVEDESLRREATLGVLQRAVEEWSESVPG